MTTLAEKRRHHYCTKHNPNQKDIEQHLIQQNRNIVNGRVVIGTASGLSVAGGEQAPTADPDGRNGWLFSKSLADTAKFNYYYYGEGNKAITLGELTGLHANISVDNYQSGLSIPFFVVYTKPTGVGDAGVWYHSKIAYTIDATETIMLGEDIEMYSLAKSDINHKHKRMVSFNTKVVTGDALSTEEILTISIHSDSSAPSSTQILVTNVGYEVLKDGEVIDRRISLN
tara:strand:- start:68 stop:751 length:684 start_codon:yes stop_codon:yes gene_type:complete